MCTVYCRATWQGEAWARSNTDKMLEHHKVVGRGCFRHTQSTSAIEQGRTSSGAPR
jgi:hypothetical protein